VCPSNSIYVLEELPDDAKGSVEANTKYYQN